jgi:transcriptional regulator with XRE-family HTH domain
MANISSADIREIRSRHGVTQAQFAQVLGTDAVTVSRWERGVSHPRPAAERRLRELVAAAGPMSKVGFVEDPTVRIRRLDRVRLDQLSFKHRARRLD